jgi:Putative Flp pilus-assembly TadE/G-like
MVAVLVAMLLVVIVGIAALAVDTSHVHAAGQQLQAAADASALAAASELATESSLVGGTYPLTRAAAVNLGAQNRAAGAAVLIDGNAGNAGSGDVVVGQWSPSTQLFLPTIVSPNAVKVTARRTADSAGGPLELVFGSMFGDATSDVSRSSIATVISSGPAFVHVLSTSASGALTASGNGSLGAAGGRVQVDSSSGSALSAVGNASINADTTAVVGGASTAGNAHVANLHVGASARSDELASILPDTAAWNGLRASMNQPAGVNGAISGSGSFAPGNYPKGLSLSGNAAAILQPGTYMFGTSFSMSGNSTLSATGVTILCDAGVEPSLAGNGSVTMTPPTSGSFQGLMLMCHRSTSGPQVLTLSGNGAINCQGSFYVPGGGAKLSGNGAAQGFGQLVCLTLTVTGNGSATGLHIVPSSSSSGGASLVQ